MAYAEAMQTTPASLSNTGKFRATLRAVAGLGLAAAALLLSGCNTNATQESNLLLFADNAPLPQIVERGTELAAAERAAQAQRGSFAVQGEGCSMEPIYVHGTAVVIRAGGYENLRAGQPVVYKTRRGTTVAHMLVRQADYGWVAVGLNNAGEDRETVTPENFVGVITHAFASKTGSLPKAVAARIALNEQVRNATKVASVGL